jgi:hypothetical protein
MSTAYSFSGGSLPSKYLSVDGTARFRHLAVPRKPSTGWSPDSSALGGTWSTRGARGIRVGPFDAHLDIDEASWVADSVTYDKLEGAIIRGSYIGKGTKALGAKITDSRVGDSEVDGAPITGSDVFRSIAYNGRSPSYDDRVV